MKFIIQNKSYFFHIEKDTIKFRYRQQCDFKDCIAIYVTCLFDIVYKILKPLPDLILTVLPLHENLLFVSFIEIYKELK